MKRTLFRRGSGVAAIAALVSAVALPAACGSSSSDGGGAAAGGAAASSGAGGGGGSANGTGTGGSSASAGTGAGFNFDASNDSPLSDSGTCAAETQKASLVPLDLYIMMDKSGSMLGTKWDSVKAALQAFVADSASADLGVGLQFFPGSPECVATTYSTPAVPIAVLPGNGTAINAALDGTGPGGQTPTQPALQGGLDYMTTWLLQNPTHKGVVVLATDGIPNNCASTVDNVATVAQTGAGGSPKVLTFVIGVGSNLTDLDKIAASGGTKTAFIVDTSANVTQQFIDALNAIRGGALACEYLIPTPEGGVIDPGKVNVTYTPGSGGQPTTWPKYANEAACPPTGEGWYYDDPTSPTKVILCPGACESVKKEAGATISVAFGCKTKVA